MLPSRFVVGNLLVGLMVIPCWSSVPPFGFNRFWKKCLTMR